MILIYLDWNVMVQIKKGLNSEFIDALDSNRFLIPYSSSHIDDLFQSYDGTSQQLKRIEDDLQFISRLTKDCCLSNDGKEVRIHFQNPKELFQQRIDEKDLFKDLSLDGLINMVGSDIEQSEALKKAMESLRAIPLNQLFSESLSNQEIGEQMDTLFPGLKENPTLEGFFKSFSDMFYNLNETEHYKQVRKVMQSGLGINRDRIYKADDPYAIIDKAYKKVKLDLSASNKNDGKYAPAWFDAISNEYIKLDLHGYQEDNISTTKGRKETFKNTTEDAFHTAFASTCDFYITSDTKLIEKSKKVYEQLGLDVLVFKPEEFMNYYKSFLTERSGREELEMPLRIIESDDKFIQKEIDNGFLRTYYVPFFIFDFFNKMTVMVSDKGKVTMILLSQQSPPNKKITYYFEIERLYPKLYEVFGNDVDNLGLVNLEELEKETWSGRKWEHKTLGFRFIRVNGHYQLYYDILKNSSEK
jgi:hypothetical protein